MSMLSWIAIGPSLFGDTMITPVAANVNNASSATGSRNSSRISARTATFGVVHDRSTRREIEMAERTRQPAAMASSTRRQSTGAPTFRSVTGPSRPRFSLTALQASSTPTG
jgi:hypothetical protein